MPRLDSFDVCAFAPTWFDVTGNLCGWMDRDFVPCATPTPPPPPTPPPVFPPPTRVSGGGGGSGSRDTIGPYVPPDWLPQYLVPYDECEELCPDDPPTADYALIHVAPPELVGAAVKALADGVVESFVDSKGRSSLVLTGDDGTRYWYADVGQQFAADGERVQAGQIIAQTKSDAPSVPAITPRGSQPMLLSAGEDKPPPPSKPAQVVFVEPPLPAFVMQPFSTPPPPDPLPLPPPRQWVKLVPIEPPPPPPPAAETIRVPDRPRPTIARVVVPAAVFAAILYVLASFEPPRRRRR